MPSIQLKKRTAQFRGFSGSRRIALRALRSICLCSFLFTTGASPRAQLPSTLTLPNGTIASGHYWYGATTSITAGTSLTIDGSASVTVLAGSTIYLMPGFTAVAGSARTTFYRDGRDSDRAVHYYGEFARRDGWLELRSCRPRGDWRVRVLCVVGNSAPDWPDAQRGWPARRYAVVRRNV